MTSRVDQIVQKWYRYLDVLYPDEAKRRPKARGKKPAGRGSPRGGYRKTAVVAMCPGGEVVYGSVSEAAAAYGLPNPHVIVACCRGRQATAGGVGWRYRDKGEPDVIETYV